MPEDPNLLIETDPVSPVTTEPAQPPVGTTVAKPEDTVDFWKQKFSDSSREAQLLVEAEKRRQAQQELTKEPTDSDLRTAFPEWDAMSDTEKSLARRTMRAERIGGNAAQLAQSIQAERSWNTSIELELTSNNALQGKEQAFRQFASRPQYKNVPMELLVDAFLSKNVTPPAPAPTPRPGLETGQGGPRETPTPTVGLTMAELAALRKTDPKAYEKYIKTHDIAIDE